MTKRTFPSIARDIAGVGREFHSRGWVLGTSGNLSVVIAGKPLRLAITASAVDKGRLRPNQILQVDAQGRVTSRGAGRPSAETLLHVEIVRRRNAGAVLHTHSVWGTMLSDLCAERGGVTLEGYEMLKGLAGNTTHEHREWIPIVDNDQNMPRLAGAVGAALDASPGAHAILLRRHGLYTWGASLADAVRHVEILEFLFETAGRSATYNGREGHHGTAANS